MNINTGAKFHLFPRFLPNDFYFFELFSKIRTYYPQADHLWFGLNIPDGHLEMEDIMKNKTNNVTSHIGKKLLVLGIITVYLCMATACGTNKNNNNSGQHGCLSFSVHLSCCSGEHRGADHRDRNCRYRQHYG